MTRSAPDRRDAVSAGRRIPRSERVLPLVRPEALDRARRGDVRAFEELYRACVGRVYAVCLRLTADPVRADEATQEVFVKAWRALPGFEGRSALSTWLHRLAVNVVLDARRVAVRRGEVALADEATDGPETPAVHEPRTPPSGPGLRLDLERAIAELPAPARTAFVLHDVEGYRHREIAEMTGVAEGTWRARLHHARRLLRERLAD